MPEAEIDTWAQHLASKLRSSSCLKSISQTNQRAMLVSLTVGKVDAGVAVLLTEDKRLVSRLVPVRR